MKISNSDKTKGRAASEVPISFKPFYRTMLRRLSCLSKKKTERGNAYGPGMGPVKDTKGQVKVKTSSSRSIGNGASSSWSDDDIAELYLTKDNRCSLYPMGVRVRLSEDQIDGEAILEDNGKLVDTVDFASCAYGLGLAKGDRLCKVNGQQLPPKKPIVFSMNGNILTLEIEKRVKCSKTGEWRRQTSIIDNTITVNVAETHECADQYLESSFSEQQYIKSGRSFAHYLTYKDGQLSYKGKSGDSLFNVISLSEVYSNDNAVPVIIQHNQTQKCLFLDNQGTVGMMDVNTDRQQFSSHESFIFKKRSFAVGTGNYILESYASQCRGARMLLGCNWDGSSYNAVAVDAANPGTVMTAFSLIPLRPK